MKNWCAVRFLEIEDFNTIEVLIKMNERSMLIAIGNVEVL